MATLTQTRATVPAVSDSHLQHDWAVVATSLWLGVGLYWDGWAHGHGLPDSFWTIWHAAFYSGFLATAIAILAPVVVARPRVGSWRAAVPAGYDRAIAGVAIFALGGVLDMVWHTLFGIEFSTDALLSPTHLLLGTGAALIVSAPFVAAAHRPQRAGLAHQLPAVLSLTLLLGVFTFFTGPYSGVIGAGARPADAVLVRSMLGVYLFSALLTGCALVALRQRTLPPGALTLMVGLNGAAMILMRDHAPLATQVTFALVAVAAGAVGDVLVWRLRPSIRRPSALRAFAFGLPAAYWAIYLGVVAMRMGTAWSPHEIGGIVFVAGVVGVLVSFVFAGGREAA